MLHYDSSKDQSGIILYEHFGALMSNLADKKVGIIGTGATSVQCVPHLARTCGELYVFQRTPSSVDVRGNGPTDMDWFEREVKEPGWQQKWLENFTANQTMGLRMPKEDLVQDGWTDLSRRIRSRMFHYYCQGFVERTLAFETEIMGVIV